MAEPKTYLELCGAADRLIHIRWVDVNRFDIPRPSGVSLCRLPGGYVAVYSTTATYPTCIICMVLCDSLAKDFVTDGMKW